METITKEKIKLLHQDMTLWRKATFTKAKRMTGPFRVITRGGATLTCPDGYLVVDSEGYPDFILKAEFEKNYASNACSKFIKARREFGRARLAVIAAFRKIAFPSMSNI